MPLDMVDNANNRFAGALYNAPRPVLRLRGDPAAVVFMQRRATNCRVRFVHTRLRRCGFGAEHYSGVVTNYPLGDTARLLIPLILHRHMEHYLECVG